MDADMDNVYMVTIMADDGTYMDAHDVTVMVTNDVEELGYAGRREAPSPTWRTAALMPWEPTRRAGR